MKNQIKLFIVLALFGTLSACNKEEVDPLTSGSFSFSAINNDLRAPSEITFSPSEEVSGATYLWDFGDGTTSTEKSPKKVFLTGGSKLISLTVTKNSVSKSDAKTLSIDKPFSKVRVTKATILNAATAYSDGTGWDYSSTGDDYVRSGPDVYLIAKFDNLTSESYYTSIKKNVTALQLTNKSLFWDHTPGFTISSSASTTDKLRIELRDADVSSNYWNSSMEQMGYTKIKLSDYMQIGNKYPTSIELEGFKDVAISGHQKYVNDALKIKLDLVWEE